ncbi:hypothetical protein [Yersinia aldovae]|uniref:hypothetical protein n=1 Tax=Yersinia aldovae TaxID=29483 RepID=UPI000AE8B3DF|nr:hypothetical protein [Yersinia aldovae]
MALETVINETDARFATSFSEATTFLNGLCYRFYWLIIVILPLLINLHVSIDFRYQQKALDK